MQAIQLQSLAKPFVSFSACKRFCRGYQARQVVLTSGEAFFGNPSNIVMQSSCWKETGMDDPPLPPLRNVFVYGTLLAPEVVSVLIDRVPRSTPAYLAQYRRYAIKGRNYPAAIPFRDSKVIGKVLFDLTDQELAVLDAFEDIEYTKELVEPLLRVDGKEIEESSALQALIYVWANVKDENLYGEWDYEGFREKELEEYVKLCEQFISEYYTSE